MIGRIKKISFEIIRCPLQLKRLIKRKSLKIFSDNNKQHYINKKWVVFGDSVTEKNIYSLINYADFIADKLGIFCINMGASGTGYKRSEEENKAFYQRILNIDTTTDVVTIMGSINDAYYGTHGTLGTATDVFVDGQDNTVCACINKTFDNLYSKIPLAKVGVITPLPNFNNYQSKDGGAIWFNDYVEALIAICKRRNIPVLDIYHHSLLKPNEAIHNALFYENDETKNTHPNTKGHKMFYPAIMEFFKTLI